MTPNPEQDPGEMRAMMQEYQKQSAHMEMKSVPSLPTQTRVGLGFAEFLTHHTVEHDPVIRSQEYQKQSAHMEMKSVLLLLVKLCIDL